MTQAPFKHGSEVRGSGGGGGGGVVGITYQYCDHYRLYRGARRLREARSITSAASKNDRKAYGMVPNSRKVTHKSPRHYIASTPRYRETYNISVYKWEYQRVDLWQPLRATQSVYDYACWAGNGSGPHPPTHRGDLASCGSTDGRQMLPRCVASAAGEWRGYF